MKIHNFHLFRKAQADPPLTTQLSQPHFESNSTGPYELCPTGLCHVWHLLFVALTSMNVTVTCISLL